MNWSAILKKDYYRNKVHDVLERKIVQLGFEDVDYINNKFDFATYYGEMNLAKFNLEYLPDNNVYYMEVKSPKIIEGGYFENIDDVLKFLNYFSEEVAEVKRKSKEVEDKEKRETYVRDYMDETILFIEDYSNDSPPKGDVLSSRMFR